jgi:AhpC/TSA family
VSEHRLDPDRAATEAGSRTPRLPEPVIDTRPYRRMIGAIGIGIAVVITALLFITHGGVGSVGIPAGQKLHWFVAPLSQYNFGKRDDANLSPRCDRSSPNPRALNICPWLAAEKPIVMAFFVPGDSDCTKEIDTLQTVSGEFSASEVEFAAVSVRGSQRTTESLVRGHGWTIPVAYDPDGAVGEIYGVEVCPLIELVDRGGVVGYRLVGDKWHSPALLADKVRALVGQ